MRKLKNDDRGVTLVEIIVSIAILAIIVLPFLNAFVTATKTNVKAKNEMNATHLATNIMEGIEKNSMKTLAYQFNYPSEGFDVADGFNISDGSSACELLKKSGKFDNVKRLEDISACLLYTSIFKNASIKYTGKSYVVLIGVENQSDIHYAIPVKNMFYDVMAYGNQVKETAKKHRKEKDTSTSDEFLSGFTKTDKLIPVITITVYLVTKEWDGPRKLSDMFGDVDEELLPFIPDYRINLLAPRLSLIHIGS